jgi:hypothetical protein
VKQYASVRYVQEEIGMSQLDAADVENSNFSSPGSDCRDPAVGEVVVVRACTA